MLPTAAELRYARRALVRRPTFVVTAVLSLGLAIAINTTMFGMIDALLRPKYPVKDQGSLFSYYWSSPNPKTYRAVAPLIHGLIRDRVTVIQDTLGDTGLRVDDGMFHVGQRVIELPYVTATTPNFWSVLGVRPYAGRLLLPNETNAGDEGLAIISFAAWRRLFPDRKAFEPFTGRAGSKEYTIVGVLPEGLERVLNGYLFTFATKPLGASMVRLKPHATRHDLELQLSMVNQALANRAGEPAIESVFRVSGFGDRNEKVTSLNIALMAAAIAVLLIACANISNLQLARGIARGRELAVRTAVGASRADIVRLLLNESVMVALAGGLLGLLLAQWGIRIARSSIPQNVGGIGFVDAQMSWRVLAGGGAATLLTALVSGLVPALLLSRTNLNELIKSGAGTAVTKTGRRQFNVLVAAEVAAALALFLGATLLFGAAKNLHSIDFGYDPRPLVTWYPSLHRQAHEILADVRTQLVSAQSTPNVAAAAAYTQREYDSSTVTVTTPTERNAERSTGIGVYRLVTSDLLRTLGVPILRGSDFIHGDDGRTPVAIVDSLAAALWWNGANPIGNMVKVGPSTSKDAWVRVIGVARHARFAVGGMDDDEDMPELYILDGLLGVDTTLKGNQWARIWAVARARGAAEHLQTEMRHTLHLGNWAWLWEDRTGFRSLRASHDFIAALFVTFAAFGIGLACLGVYGVVAHSVAQRTREFGVRIALGANAARIVTMVIAEGNAITLSGIAVGLITGWWGVRLVEYFLYGIRDSTELAILGAGPFVIFGVATLAMLAPAIRAGRVNPVEALRYD